MTLGELYDSIESLRSAEVSVVKACQALGYGGNEDTMARKRAWLQDCERLVEELRDEELS